MSEPSSGVKKVVFICLVLLISPKEQQKFQKLNMHADISNLVNYIIKNIIQLPRASAEKFPGWGVNEKKDRKIAKTAEK